MPSPRLHSLDVVTLRVLVLAVVLALLTAACGGDSTTTEPPPTSESVLTTAPSELTTTSTTEPEGDVFHIVQSGETLSAIAATYSLTLQQVLDANPAISDPGRISVNMQILIPEVEEAATNTTLPPLELDPTEEPDLPDVRDTTTTTEPLATTTTTG